MKLLFAYIMILSAGLSGAQTRWDKLEKVGESDVAIPALKGWEQELAAAYRKKDQPEPSISQWHVLQTASLKALFPHFRFYVVSWSEGRKPGRLDSPAVGLEMTMVTDQEGKRLMEIHQTGNYEPFGELLKKAEVVVRNEADAGLVWSAFCDVHQRHWQTQPSVKVDDRIWHLGESKVEGRRYYYEVKLDGALGVESAKLRSDIIGAKE